MTDPIPTPPEPPNDPHTGETRPSVGPVADPEPEEEQTDE